MVASTTPQIVAPFGATALPPTSGPARSEGLGVPGNGRTVSGCEEGQWELPAYTSLGREASRMEERVPGRVLIVTDAQEGFTRQGNLASPECTAAIPRIRRIVEDEIAVGTPVLFTKDSHVENDAEFRMFPPHCIVGTEEHHLVEELRGFEPDAAAVIQKRRYSAFFDTDLEQYLKELDPFEVHMTGFCTNKCVLPTPSDLSNRD